MLKFEVDHMAGLLLGDLPGRQPFSSTPTDKPPVGDQLESGGGGASWLFFLIVSMTIMWIYYYIINKHLIS